MHAVVLVVSLMNGGLLAEREPSPQVHLVDSSALQFVASGVTSAARDAIETMSVPELQAEAARLRESTRSLVVPIVLLASGAALVITANVIWFFTYDLVGALVGSLIAITGGVLVVVGTIMLIASIVSNAKNSTRLTRVEERIDQLGRPVPGSDAPPPPPPPPPPSGLMAPPPPQLLLATF